MALCPAYQDGLWVSVVIATYNRPELLRRLLLQFEEQTLPKDRFEVVAVDDGSREDMRVALADLHTSYRLHVERQANAGAARARQRGAEVARGHVLVILDDDMQVGPDYLEKHLEHHTDDHTVVLGRFRPSASLEGMPLFERFYAKILGEVFEGHTKGPVRGHQMYTGNVSIARELFLRAGGFDPEFKAIEDEELGIRLEKRGARFAFSNEAVTIHDSDQTSTEKWLNRSFRDGVYSTKVSHKHKDHLLASPWRHLAAINPISKPFLALSLAAPRAAGGVAKAAVLAAQVADKAGLEPVAIAGTTLVYGMQYYRGVREEMGSLGAAVREYREFSRAAADVARGGGEHRGAYREMVAAIREDHRMMAHYAGKYDARGGGDGGGLASDAVKKIGFQVMVAYRIMRFFRASGRTLAAQAMSRVIRHLYSSDIHWDAELEPGVVVVHGFGLAISYAARVSSGCILYQGVTLGYGNDPVTKRAGAPLLEKNVHVGIGATLYGPITIGEGSKITAGCVVSQSVPARSVIEAPAPAVRPRAG